MIKILLCLIPMLFNFNVSAEVLPCITFENTVPPGPENQVCIIGEDSDDQNLVYFLVSKQVPFTEADATCASAGVKINREYKDMKLISKADVIILENQYGGEPLMNPVWTSLASIPDNPDPIPDPESKAVALGDSGYTAEDKVIEMQPLCQARKP